MIRLHESLTQRLLGEPETGMGYQLVEVAVGVGRPGYALVFNAQRALETAPGTVHLVREATDVTKRQLTLELLEPTRDLRIRTLSAGEARRSGLLIHGVYKTDAGPASEAPLELSGNGERFLRFSAFRDDLRIRADGSVRPHTYVTTHEDGITFVKTGMDAVRRYALPNPDPAVHRFFLTPPVAIQVRRGRVQPAHGQLGGGAEVIFEDGAPARTKYHQDELPPGYGGP